MLKQSQCSLFFLTAPADKTETNALQEASLDFPMVGQREEQIKLDTVPISTSGKTTCNIILKMLGDLSTDMCL